MENEEKIETEVTQEEVEKDESLADKAKTIAKNTVTKGKEITKKAYDNREKIAKFVVGAAGTIALTAKTISTVRTALGGNKTKYERTVEQRRTQYYDPSSRRYWELRREPTTRELIEIENRRSHGEPVSMILRDLDLLNNW